MIVQHRAGDVAVIQPGGAYPQMVPSGAYPQMVPSGANSNSMMSPGYPPQGQALQPPGYSSIGAASTLGQDQVPSDPPPSYTDAVAATQYNNQSSYGGFSYNQPSDLSATYTATNSGMFVHIVEI